MNRYFSQPKSWIVAIASGAIMLLMIGFALFHENPSALAGTAATMTAISMAQANATWKAYIVTVAPQKATWEAAGEAAAAARPTLTPFNKMATPPPFPTLPPTTYLQRTAGAGRLIGAFREPCGNQCLVLNRWVERTKDKYILVSAAVQGMRDPAPPQAQVVVEWVSLSDHKPMPGGGIFPVPMPAQSVMIVDAIGEQLTLRANDGTTLVFDVPSQQYVSASQTTTLAQRQADVGVVVENSDVPFTRPGFSVANRWSGNNGGSQITVYAGADGGDNKDLDVGKGMLAIVASQGQPIATDMPQVYYPPDKAYGALWVFDVKGNLATVVDRAGNEFVFDLAARRFVPLWEAKTKLLDAPLFDQSMPTSNATPQPVVPLVIVPSTPMAPAAYPILPTAYP